MLYILTVTTLLIKLCITYFLGHSLTCKFFHLRQNRKKSCVPLRQSILFLDETRFYSSLFSFSTRLFFMIFISIFIAIYTSLFLNVVIFSCRTLWDCSSRILLRPYSSSRSKLLLRIVNLRHTSNDKLNCNKTKIKYWTPKCDGSIKTW